MLLDMHQQKLPLCPLLSLSLCPRACLFAVTEDVASFVFVVIVFTPFGNAHSTEVFACLPVPLRPFSASASAFCQLVYLCIELETRRAPHEEAEKGQRQRLKPELKTKPERQRHSERGTWDRRRRQSSQQHTQFACQTAYKISKHSKGAHTAQWGKSCGKEMQR